MNGRSKIYARGGNPIDCDVKEATGHEIDITEEKRKKEIRLNGYSLTKGNVVFRNLILKPDIKAGIKQYNEGRKKR